MTAQFVTFIVAIVLVVLAALVGALGAHFDDKKEKHAATVCLQVCLLLLGSAAVAGFKWALMFFIN